MPDNPFVLFFCLDQGTGITHLLELFLLTATPSSRGRAEGAVPLHKNLQNNGSSSRELSEELLLTWQGTERTGIGDVVVVLRVPLSRKSPAAVPVV